MCYDRRCGTSVVEIPDGVDAITLTSQVRLFAGTFVVSLVDPVGTTMLEKLLGARPSRTVTEADRGLRKSGHTQ